MKPDSLRDIRKPSWKYVLKKSLREFGKDECPNLAAGLTYYSVLAMFPALIAVFSLLGVIGQGREAADAVLGIIDEAAPGGMADTLRAPIEELAESQLAGVALLTGIVVAVWSASGYVGAFARALNRVWEVDEGRPVWKLKPAQLAITLAAIVLLAAALVILIVSGPVAAAIGAAVGLGDIALTVWSIAKWPVLAIIVVMVVALLYYFTPNAKQPRFRWISAGAVLAIAVLAVATVGFGFYVANFSHYERTYGSLAGVIVFLLWLWIANMALLAGAEFDAELERGRELQGGLHAEERIQLPPRDDSKIRKDALREAEEVQEARRLRASGGRRS